MKDFLKKYLSDEQLAEVEKKYTEANPGSKGLPTYISKGRLDEVLDQKKKAETSLAEKEAELANSQKTHEEALKTYTEAAQAEYTKKLKEETDKLSSDFSLTEAIYKVKGRNVKAIKALVDPTKKHDEELTRIQKEAPYLFDDAIDIPGGTGKNGEGDKHNADLEIMRKAVGL